MQYLRGQNNGTWGYGMTRGAFDSISVSNPNGNYVTWANLVKPHDPLGSTPYTLLSQHLPLSHVIVRPNDPMFVTVPQKYTPLGGVFLRR